MEHPQPPDASGWDWWMWWRRRRHVVAVLAFFGFFNVYSLRVNLSVAIVAMTSPTNLTLPNGTSILMEPEFAWDSKFQGIVLSSFFYGYIWTQVLGGWLAAKVGGARIYCAGIGFTAVCTLLTPPVAATSDSLFIFLRVLEGLFEGVTYPCIHAVWSRWAPPSERAAMVSFSFSGSYVGTVVALPLSGILANSLGWQYVFYITGSFGVLWCILWIIHVRDRPEDDKRITQEELKYLQETLKQTETTKVAIPWKDIFTSMPVWAVILSHFCENWGFYTLLTQLPTFMKDILEFDLKNAGFMSAVPYLVMAITMQFAGRIADWMCNSKILSITNVRKLFNGTAFISQTVFMVLAGYLLSPVGVTVCLVFAVGLGAFAWPAFSVNHLDLAPRHASLLMGISNTFATLPGIISPLLTGYIVSGKTRAEWRVVFFLSSGIYLVGAVFYSIFASGERQPWAEPEDKSEHDSAPPAYDNLAASLTSLPPAHTPTPAVLHPSPT